MAAKVTQKKAAEKQNKRKEDEAEAGEMRKNNPRRLESRAKLA